MSPGNPTSPLSANLRPTTSFPQFLGPETPSYIPFLFFPPCKFYFAFLQGELRLNELPPCLLPPFFFITVGFPAPASYSTFLRIHSTSLAELLRILEGSLSRTPVGSFLLCYSLLFHVFFPPSGCFEELNDWTWILHTSRMRTRSPFSFNIPLSNPSPCWQPLCLVGPSPTLDPPSRPLEEIAWPPRVR